MNSFKYLGQNSLTIKNTNSQTIIDPSSIQINFLLNTPYNYNPYVSLVDSSYNNLLLDNINNLYLNNGSSSIIMLDQNNNTTEFVNIDGYTVLDMAFDTLRLNLYVLGANGTIYKVDSNKNSVVYLSGLTNIKNPIAIDNNNNIYYVDNSNYIYKIDSDKNISLFVNNSNNLLTSIKALACDSSGSLYVADTNIIKYNANGSLISSSFISNGSPFYNIVIDNDNGIYTSSGANGAGSQIDKYNINGVFISNIRENDLIGGFDITIDSNDIFFISNNQTIYTSSQTI